MAVHPGVGPGRPPLGIAVALNWRPGLTWAGPGWWAGVQSVGFVGRERSCPAWRGRSAVMRAWCWWRGTPGLARRGLPGRDAAGCSRGDGLCLGGCLPLAGELPLLPVADALGELSRLRMAGCWRRR